MFDRWLEVCHIPAFLTGELHDTFVVDFMQHIYIYIYIDVIAVRLSLYSELRWIALYERKFIHSLNETWFSVRFTDWDLVIVRIFQISTRNVFHELFCRVEKKHENILCLLHSKSIMYSLRYSSFGLEKGILPVCSERLLNSYVVQRAGLIAYFFVALKVVIFVWPLITNWDLFSSDLSCTALCRSCRYCVGMRLLVATLNSTFVLFYRLCKYYYWFSRVESTFLLA